MSAARLILRLDCDTCGKTFDAPLDIAKPIGPDFLQAAARHAGNEGACVLDVAELLAHDEGVLPRFGAKGHMCEPCYDAQTGEDDEEW